VYNKIFPFFRSLNIVFVLIRLLPVQYRVLNSFKYCKDEAEDTDFSQLIDNLDVDEEKEGVTSTAYTVFASEEELAQTATAAASPSANAAAAAVVTQEQLFVNDAAECAEAALKAVHDILGDMNAMDCDDEQGTATAAATTQQADQENGGKEEASKLFPIFYKTAVQGGGDSANSSSPNTARVHTGNGIPVPVGIIQVHFCLSGTGTYNCNASSADLFIFLHGTGTGFF
jgi:hypothetical protein